MTTAIPGQKRLPTVGEHCSATALKGCLPDPYRLPPSKTDFALDRRLYGPDLEAHYYLCMVQVARDPLLDVLPYLRLELRRYELALDYVRTFDRSARPEARAAGLGGQGGSRVPSNTRQKSQIETHHD